MTPKEKAKELINKFKRYVDDTIPGERAFEYSNKQEILNCVECAKITVDEVIEQWKVVDAYIADAKGELNLNLRYWLEVKHEVNNFIFE